MEIILPLFQIFIRFAELFFCKLEIFALVLFSRNLEYANHRENKILAKWRNHFVNY